MTPPPPPPPPKNPKQWLFSFGCARHIMFNAIYVAYHCRDNRPLITQSCKVLNAPIILLFSKTCLTALIDEDNSKLCCPLSSLSFFALVLKVLLWKEFICWREAFCIVQSKDSPVSSLLGCISVTQDGQAETLAMKYKSQSTKLCDFMLTMPSSHKSNLTSYTACRILLLPPRRLCFYRYLFAFPWRKKLPMDFKENFRIVRQWYKEQSS